MTTAAEVVLAAIPDADKDVVDYVLWGRTPFPVGRVTARSLYKAASGFKRACDHKLRLCDHCHRPAMTGEWECSHCRAVLDQARSA